MCLGVPARIVAVRDASACLVAAEIGGVRREICLACLVQDGRALQDWVGEWVLVHAGFALSRIDAAEARRTLELLAALEAPGAETHGG